MTGPGSKLALIPTQRHPKQVPISYPNDVVQLLATTNIAPSDTEVEQIQRLICHEERELEKLEDEVLRIQSILNDLQRRCAQRRTRIHEYEGVLTPLRRFPTELLADIFVKYAGNDFLQPSQGAPPLILGHICSRWRSVAIGMPQLWAGGLFRASHISDLGLFEDFWLSRAGKLPLDVCLGKCDRSSRPFFREYAHRFRHLDLTASCLEGLYPASMPLLESLTWRKDVVLQSKVSVFEFAPRLHRVTFVNSRFPEVPDAFWIPWEQLTELYLLDRYIPLDVCLSILSRCPNLIKCSFYLMRSRNTHVPVPRMSLPYLQNLEITIRGTTTSIDQLFPHLLLPSLDTLIVAFSVEFTVNAPLGSLSRSLQYLSSTLKHFTLRNVDDPSFHWAELFAIVPSLTRLTLLHCYITPKLIYGIAYGDAPAPILPCLEHLELDGEAASDLDFDAVADLVGTRWAPPTGRQRARLKSAYFHFSSAWCVTDKAEKMRLLDRYRAEGLDVGLEVR